MALRRAPVKTKRKRANQAGRPTASELERRKARVMEVATELFVEVDIRRLVVTGSRERRTGPIGLFDKHVERQGHRAIAHFAVGIAQCRWIPAELLSREFGQPARGGVDQHRAGDEFGIQLVDEVRFFLDLFLLLLLD